MPATPASGPPIGSATPEARTGDQAPEQFAADPYATDAHANPTAGDPFAVGVADPAQQPGSYAAQPQEYQQQQEYPQQQPQYGAGPFGGMPYGYDSPTESHHRPVFGRGGGRTGGLGRGRTGAGVAAGLAFLVVVLGVPALVLTWRSAVGPHVSAPGLVASLLAVVGLVVLAAGLFPLITGKTIGKAAGKAAGETTGETTGEGDAEVSGFAALTRPPALLAILGTVLLLGAAIAV
jgi:hypothetical protein